MSHREDIIRNIVETLSSVDLIQSVRRSVLEDNDLEKIPQSNFPLALIVGRLPVVTYNDFACETEPMLTQGDVLESELETEIFVFMYDNHSPDTQISTLLVALWAALNTDRSRGGFTTSTRINFENTILNRQPYYLIKLTVLCHYQHSYQEI